MYSSPPCLHTVHKPKRPTNRLSHTRTRPLPLQELLALADSMLAGTPHDPTAAGSTAPPDLQSRQWALLPPVVLDAVPPGAVFGQVGRVDEGGGESGGEGSGERDCYCRSGLG